MKISPLRLGLFAAAVILASGLVTLDVSSKAAMAQGETKVRDDLAGLAFPAYARQKVVYQVTDAGGWFGRHYTDLLGSLKNHVAAVGADRIDLRVVLSGRGVDLLRDPDAKLRERLDSLRALGVRFFVCRNTLIATATEPDALYNVSKRDIVQAGVAEVAALEAQGFVYMRL